MIETSHGFQCEAEVVNGPLDGFVFTMIRLKRPDIGTRMLQHGQKYVLKEFKDGKALFFWKPN